MGELSLREGDVGGSEVFLEPHPTADVIRTACGSEAVPRRGWVVATAARTNDVGAGTGCVSFNIHQNIRLTFQ